MPIARRRCSTPKLKSGLSTPTKQCGAFACCWATSSRRIRSSSGSRFKGSIKPITASRSIGCKVFSPAAIICSPPIPSTCRSYPCADKALSTAAPNISPDISPAQIPRRNDLSATNGRCPVETASGSQSRVVNWVFLPPWPEAAPPPHLRSDSDGKES